MQVQQVFHGRSIHLYLGNTKSSIDREVLIPLWYFVMLMLMALLKTRLKPHTHDQAFP